jgi:hypothetical protein
MNAPSARECRQLAVEEIQRTFLAILPRLEKHGKVYFRDLKSPERKDEAISEMLALAWSWFIRLAERGKDASQFASVLATFAARAVRSGRRLCGQEKAKDVLSPVAQQRHGFSVSPLPVASSSEGNIFDEALVDNMTTPIIDQVQFRLDFPRWRASRSARDRSLIDDLMVGERPFRVSQKYGLSRSRVSELRRQMCEDWTNFAEGASRLCQSAALIA